MNSIYKRTAKGDEEIRNRTYKLDHALRFILIMIDGKAAVDNIISRSSEQWKPIECLFELETRGFIENIDQQSSKASLSAVQQNLILSIQKNIPNNNAKIINKIISSPLDRKSLEKAIDSACIFIKLTISEDISKSLKLELHHILSRSTEV